MASNPERRTSRHYEALERIRELHPGSASKRSIRHGGTCLVHHIQLVEHTKWQPHGLVFVLLRPHYELPKGLPRRSAIVTVDQQVDAGPRRAD